MATGISFSGSNFPIFIEEQPLSDLSRRSSAFFPFPFAPLFLNSRQEIKFFPVVSFLPPSSPVRYLAGERQFRRRRKFNREQGFSRCQRFNHWTAINASRPSLSYFSLRFVRPRNSSSVLSRLPAIPDASWNCLIITSLADSDRSFESRAPMSAGLHSPSHCRTRTRNSLLEIFIAFWAK